MKRRVQQSECLYEKQQQVPIVERPSDDVTMESYKELFAQLTAHGFGRECSGWNKRFVHLTKQVDTQGGKVAVAFAMSISFVMPTLPQDIATCMMLYKTNCESALRCMAGMPAGNVQYTTKVQGAGGVNMAVIISAFQLKNTN